MKHSDINHRSALLQIMLTHGDVIHETSSLWMPDNIMLEMNLLMPSARWLSIKGLSKAGVPFRAP